MIDEAGNRRRKRDQVETDGRIPSRPPSGKRELQARGQRPCQAVIQVTEKIRTHCLLLTIALAFQLSRRTVVTGFVSSPRLGTVMPPQLSFDSHRGFRIGFWYLELFARVFADEKNAYTLYTW